MALFRGILVLGVLFYLAGVSGTLTVLSCLVVVLAIVSPVVQSSSAKKPAAIAAATGTLWPKLRRVK